VSRGPGPYLLAELSSGAATCSSAPYLTSLLRWAPALPRVPWLWALPPREESSGAATCSSAPDLASLPRWAPVLPRVTWLRALPPREESSDAATCSSAPDLASLPRWARMCLKHAAGLTCVQSTITCYRGACKACGHTVTVRFNSATHAQLTTPRHDYSGDTIRYDGTTALTMFSIAG
jgi:hypothetical protein